MKQFMQMMCCAWALVGRGVVVAEEQIEPYQQFQQRWAQAQYQQ